MHELITCIHAYIRTTYVLHANPPPVTSTSAHVASAAAAAAEALVYGGHL